MKLRIITCLSVLATMLTCGNAYQVTFNLTAPVHNVFVSAHEFNGDVYAWDLFPLHIGDVPAGQSTFDLGSHNVVSWAIFGTADPSYVVAGINDSINPPNGLPFSYIFPGYDLATVRSNTIALWNGAYNTLPAYFLFSYVLNNEDPLKTDQATGVLHIYRFNNGFDLGTATITNLPLVSGNVVLEDFLDPTGQQVTLQMLTAGTVVETHTVTLDGSGNFSFIAGHTGTFDITAKSSHWLNSRQVGIAITPSGVSGLGFSLANGDCDGDNEITLADYAMLANAFGSIDGDPNWNPNADLDGDTEVTLNDYSILSRNFGLAGD